MRSLVAMMMLVRVEVADMHADFESLDLIRIRHHVPRFLLKYQRHASAACSLL